jgi:hypothetical protein
MRDHDARIQGKASKLTDETGELARHLVQETEVSKGAADVDAESIAPHVLIFLWWPRIRSGASRVGR